MGFSSQMTLVVLALSCFCWRGSSALTKPNPDLLQWSRYEIGAMISWNIDTMDGIQGCNLQMPSLPLIYLFDNATGVNFEQWARVMQTVGVKYSVLTVKHGCGFTLWPSKISGINRLPYYNYSIAYNSFFAGRDLVREYYAAMKKYGIRPGFYYSLGSNMFLGVSGGKASPASTHAVPGQVILTEDEYYNVVYQHIDELLTTYPDMYEFWFDGGVPKDVETRLNALFAKKAPHVVTFQGYGLTKNVVRWPATESGHPKQDMWSTTDSYGDPNVNGTYWYPAECDTTMQNGDTWFFNSQVGPRSLEEMKSVYHDTVGNNCNMMLNFAPDTHGQLHYEENYRTFGDFISMCYPSDPKYYAAHISSPPMDNHSSFFLNMERTTLIDRVVLKENQTVSECVLGFNLFVYNAETLVYFTTGKWIANKRILLLPKPVEVNSVQVRIEKQHEGCVPALELLAAAQCNPAY